MKPTGGGVNASQTISLNRKCQDLILRSACLPSVRENVLVPILEYLAREAEPKFTLKDDPIKVMWHLFRQGSFMCELLNQVQPGVIQSVSLPIAPMGSTNFTDTNSRQNVAAFVKASRDMFFMTDDELFNPGDLYKEDFNAFSKAMALCDMYLNNKIRVSTRNSYSLNVHSFDPEIAYLFNVDEERTSATVLNNSPDVESKKKASKREHILEEMIASERVYVDDLARLNKYKEMVKFERLLSQKTVDLTFANLKDLLNFQRKFMIDMETQIRKETPDFGALFMLHEADFKLYEEFCLNHSVALESLKEHKKILEARPDLLEGVGDLEGYFIKPIQRVTRYSLFMRDLNKEAGKSGDEAEIKSTEIALDSVKRIANRINERQRAAENERTSIWFFSHFHPKVLNPEKTGKLVLHDNSTKLKLDNELKVYQVFLFQKKLIMCAEKESFGAFWMKNKISTNSITEVIEMESGDYNAPYEAQVTCLVSDKAVTFSLFFRTLQMQRMWINTLRGLAELPLIEFKDKAPETEMMTEATATQRELANETVSVPVLPKKTRVRINFRGEYFSIIVKEKLNLLELYERIETEIIGAYQREFQTLHDLPSTDRMRLRFKDEDGVVVRLTSDEVLEDLLAERALLDLILFEGDPVRVRFTYRDCLYNFQLDDLSAIEELRIYIYETILEDYRLINANTTSIPKGDSMRLFVREPDGEWSLMLYDNDLDVALKLSDRKLEIKL